MVLKLRLGDTLRLKKGHPCGGYLWTVLRLGADIRIECLVCRRITLHKRSSLEHHIKEVMPQRNSTLQSELPHSN